MNTTVEVWANEDVVADIDITTSGQKRVNLFLVDFFDPEKTAAIHLGPKQALEIIEELRQALLDLHATL